MVEALALPRGAGTCPCVPAVAGGSVPHRVEGWDALCPAGQRLLEPWGGEGAPGVCVAMPSAQRSRVPVKVP